MNPTPIEPKPVVVFPGDKKVWSLLKRRRDESPVLRWTSFHIRQPVEEGLLLFHTMTLEFLLLPKPLLAGLEAPEGPLRDFLREHWFLIPEDLDEHRMAQELRETLFLMERRPDGIEKYTILTTTACNANCFYCYEKDWPSVTMSEALADQTADYILRTAAPRFHIDWFGGEPLVNMKAIDRISDRLLAAGADFSSSMFSNCYLFDEDVVRRAAERWKLQAVSVTLDGRRELYNRTKAYVDPKEDPFTRVMRNIHLLDRAGVETLIRINLDAFNREEAGYLAEDLIREFAGTKRRSIYAIPIYEYVNDPSTWLSDEERTENTRVMRALRRRLADAGVAYYPFLERTLITHKCMADSGNMVMILPNGKIGLCEHYLHDNFIGDIWSETLDPSLTEEFRVQHPDIPACADCPIYPQCIRPKKCESHICYPQYREYLTQTRRDAMQLTWKRYLRRLEKQAPAQDGV